MTQEEYGRICDRLARKAIRYAAEKVADEALSDLDSQCEHWIDVYLDEHLPKIDTDALLDVTSHAGAFEKSAGRPPPSREIAAFHALQADVWDAINRMETTAKPGEEETVARGMLSRYKSAKVAMEMAHWHAMDHAPETEHRARWLRVKEAIARLKKAP